MVLKDKRLEASIFSPFVVQFPCSAAGMVVGDFATVPCPATGAAADGFAAVAFEQIG